MFDKFKEFQGEDVVYHYCPVDTAVQYILHEKRLRLSPRNQASDPFESHSPFIFHSTGHYKEDFILLKGDSERLRKDVLNHVKLTKQLCFCMNKEDLTIPIQLEYYGFSKSRMWDQYANKYTGVCLAFSLSKIEELIPRHMKYAKVQYLNYRELSKPKWNIDEDSLSDLGIEKYQKILFEKFDQYLFHKHEDYKDENELKILSFSESDIDFIEFADSLVGIFYNEEKISDFNLEQLKSYSKSNEVDLFGMSWRDGGVYTMSLKEKENSRRLMKEAVAKYKQQRSKK